MDESTSPPSTPDLLLRDVEHGDLAIFFEHQRDPDAVAMADFPARDWNTFITHWTKILNDPTIIKKTILLNGQVVGSLVSFEQRGKREVGYWLGRQFWGQGLATRALTLFLEHVPTRPLYAYVAQHNIGSRRVLEKCGFVIRGKEGNELMLELP